MLRESADGGGEWEAGSMVDAHEGEAGKVSECFIHSSGVHTILHYPGGGGTRVMAHVTHPVRYVYYVSIPYTILTCSGNGEWEYSRDATKASVLPVLR